MRAALKSGKAVAPDDIPVDVQKMCREEGIGLFNQTVVMLRERVV